MKIVSAALEGVVQIDPHGHVVAAHEPVADPWLRLHVMCIYRKAADWTTTVAFSVAWDGKHKVGNIGMVVEAEARVDRPNSFSEVITEYRELTDEERALLKQVMRIALRG
jgi:hypothetical protein